MRMLDSGHFSGVPAVVRMERRRDERSQMYFHESYGLRLPRVPILRHNNLSRLANRCVLRSYISGDRKAGQSHKRD